MAKLFANNTISEDYAKQLSKEHDGSKWGTTGAKYAGNNLLETLTSRPYIQTALDWGAGKGMLGEFIVSNLPYITWTNYDPGIPHYDKLPKGPFDLVVSSDVMEHVEPELVTSVLQEMERRCSRLLYLDIACTPTGRTFAEGPYKGQDLHLVVEKPDWWRQTVRKVLPQNMIEAGYMWREYRSRGMPRIRCTLIYERV